MRHEQQGFLQHTSVTQLFAVHLLKKIGGPVLFFYGKHRGGERMCSHEGPAWASFFLAYRTPLLVFGLQKTCWQIAGGLRNTCCSGTFSELHQCRCCALSLEYLPSSHPLCGLTAVDVCHGTPPAFLVATVICTGHLGMCLGGLEDSGVGSGGSTGTVT